MKNILVPVDFSQFAENALRWAKMIAEKGDAKIYLLHAVEPMKAYTAASEGYYVDAEIERKYLDFLEEGAKTKLKQLLNKPEFNNLNVESIIKIDGVYTAIKYYVEQLHIDLIVMGTQGVSGWDEILVGSNTQMIVRTASCPVLSVSNPPTESYIKNIVFATGLNDDSLKIIPELKQFQNLLDAHIHLLYVNVPNNFLTEREIETNKNNFLSEAKLSNFSFKVYNDLNEEQGILHFTDDIQADLVAIATHQRKGFAHFISGSITENIVNQAIKPVLTFGLRKK